LRKNVYIWANHPLMWMLMLAEDEIC